MHGHTKIKFLNAKQAKGIYLYKNIKRKLHKTNAAVWYNKTCRGKQLTPNYIERVVRNMWSRLEINKSKNSCILLVVIYNYTSDGRTHEHQIAEFLVIVALHNQSAYKSVLKCYCGL
jgi:hypothetical protein